MRQQEYRIACAICDYVARQYPQHVRDKRFFAIENGGHRNKVTAGRLKRAGVTPGVSDYCITTPCGPYSTLWIELKHEGGKLSPDQKIFLRAHRSDGHLAVAAYGFDEAKAIIDAWMCGDSMEVEWYARSDTKSQRNKAWKERTKSAIEESVRGL